MDVDQLLRDALDEVPVAAPAGDDDRRAVTGRARHLRRRSAGLTVALALSLIGVMVAGLVFTHPDDTTTEVAGPAGTTGPAAAPVPTGDAAWVLPPTTAAGYVLHGAQGGGRRNNSPQTVTESIGTVTLAYDQAEAFRQTTYYYATTSDAPDLQPQVDPPLRLTAANRSTVLQASHTGSGNPSMGGAARDSWQSIDLEQVCTSADNGRLVTALFSAHSRCRQVSIAWRGDVVVVVDADPGSDTMEVVAGIEIVTLDQLARGLDGVPGVDEVVRSGSRPVPPPMTMPTTTLPDTPFCRAWGEVMAAVADSSATPNRPMLDAMERAAQVAPPELAEALRVLGQQWSVDPYPPESGRQMAIVMNLVADQCGTMTAAVPPA